MHGEAAEPRPSIFKRWRKYREAHPPWLAAGGAEAARDAFYAGFGAAMLEATRLGGWAVRDDCRRAMERLRVEFIRHVQSRQVIELYRLTREPGRKPEPPTPAAAPIPAPGRRPAAVSRRLGKGLRTRDSGLRSPDRVPSLQS